MEIIQFFGRLHPIILHLPIGILAVAFLMEWAGRKEKYAKLLPAVGFAIQLGMWSAILACGSGYLLSWEGGYNDTMLWQHKWLGIGTAAISVIVYFLHKGKNSRAGKKLYFPIFGILMLLIGATGHLGGSLTHGSDFLTEPFSGEKKNEEVAISNMDSAMVFQDLVQPIFKKKCVSCHNESKIKGELLMTTVEGFKKGGKTGAFFVAGNASKSLFLQRAHLPLEEKEHMPPKGKKQLTKDEITLLEWWVEQGGDFDKQVANLEQLEEIKTILAKYTEVDKSIFALNVDPASPSTIQKLRQAGIPIEIISEEKPFVTASLRGRKDLDKSVLKQLQNISEQLIELDLSNTNMNDELISYLDEFPHLQKLFLQKTQVTGKNLDVLDELEYLEYLNLYNTPLEDEALEPITKLANLQSIYLWQTNVSPKAIEQLKNTRPRLNVNTGIDDEIFGSAELKSPLIMVKEDIFTDSVLVKFVINFRGVDIFYTLDGTTPDSTSLKYSEPFYLKKTAEIKVVGKKEGWGTSLIAQKTVVRAKYQIADIALDKLPHERYQAEGPNSLINFKKGTTNFTEGEWLGYEKSGMIATLDMGKNVEVSNVSVSALDGNNSYIFFPKQINVSISENGKNFKKVAEKSIPMKDGPEPPSIQNFILPFEAQNARYIKVEVKSNLVNPKWHAAPGAACWIFVDEIMVE
ncbi:MAG: FN3 associated domain-containing protein [Saprospiraceae bacterium]